MQKTVKMTQKGKTFRKWANEQNIYEVEKETKPRGCSDPVLGLYTFIWPFYSNKFIGIYLRSQESVYRTIGLLVLNQRRGKHGCQKYC